jgi:hypothetical protein
MSHHFVARSRIINPVFFPCSHVSAKAGFVKKKIFSFTELRRSFFRETIYWILRAGRLRSRSSNSGRVKNFLFSKSPRPTPGSTQPPIQWVPVALSPGLKRSGREADHSPPTSAEVKKIWIYTSTPPYAFMA